MTNLWFSVNDIWSLTHLRESCPLHVLKKLNVDLLTVSARVVGDGVVCGQNIILCPLTNGSLMQVKSIAECSKGSILHYF